MLYPVTLLDAPNIIYQLLRSPLEAWWCLPKLPCSLFFPGNQPDWRRLWSCQTTNSWTPRQPVRILSNATFLEICSILWKLLDISIFWTCPTPSPTLLQEIKDNLILSDAHNLPTTAEHEIHCHSTNSLDDSQSVKGFVFLEVIAKSMFTLMTPTLTSTSLPSVVLLIRDTTILLLISVWRFCYVTNTTPMSILDIWYIFKKNW